MKRQQIIILILAVLSVAGLYSLPRVVVDNDENEGGAIIDTTSPEGAGVDHSAEIPAEALPAVTRWKTQLMAGSMMTDNEAALDSLMLVFQSVNKYDSAAYYAGRYAEAYPETEHWRKAGDAHYEAFKFAVDEAKTEQLATQARNYYDKILNAGVNDLEARNNIAMMLVSTSNPMQGVMMLREILAEAPDDKSALFNIGVLSIRSQQFERAVERFETLVGYHPKHLEGQYYLGVSYFETGQLDKAKSQFEKVKQMDSDAMVQTAADEYLERIGVKN